MVAVKGKKKQVLHAVYLRGNVLHKGYAHADLFALVNILLTVPVQINFAHSKSNYNCVKCGTFILRKSRFVILHLGSYSNITDISGFLRRGIKLKSSGLQALLLPSQTKP